MRSRSKSVSLSATALLFVISLPGCASPSPATPIVLPRSEITPLPLQTREIDLKPSEAWSLKAQNWLQKLESLSSGETLK